MSDRKTARQTVRDHPVSSGTFSVSVLVVAALNLANITLSQSQEQSLIILLGAAPALITAGIGFWRKMRSP